MLFETEIETGISYPVSIPIAAVTFAFDWGNACLHMESGSPVEVTGEEAVREWIQYIVRVVRGRYAIHPENFGASPVSLVGTKLPRGAELSELERYLKETTAYCPGIQSVSKVTYDGTAISCTVTLADETTITTEVISNGP